MVTFGTPTYAGSPTPTTSLAIERPADLGNGDVLIIAIRSQDGSGSLPWTSTTGFTLLTADPILPSTGARVAGIYARPIVDITKEPASYTFTGPPGRAVGMALACHGASEGDLVSAGRNAYGGGSAAVGGVIDMPSMSITVPSHGLILLSAECVAGVSGVPSTIPDGYTTIGNVQSSLDTSSTGSRTAIWLGWREETTTPVTGVRGGYATASGVGLYYGAFTGGRGATSPEPEPVVIPEGFRSVAQMLATPGATWAHRGGSSNWPEMSALAFRNSALKGYGALEFSCGRSSDGVWFGLHDTTLNRTSGTTGLPNVDTMTWAQIQEHKITLNANGDPQPYFKMTDFLDIYASTHVVIMDIKYGWNFAQEWFNILKSYTNDRQRIIVKYFGPTSFSAQMRDYVRSAGFASWGYYYPEQVADGELARTQDHWSILGMDYGASQADWDAILAYGKPVVGHIVQGVPSANMALSKGAHMLQCANVATIPAVGPRDNPQPWDAIYVKGSRVPAAHVRLGTTQIWP